MMGAIIGKLWMMGLQACALIFMVLITRHFLRRYPKIYSYWLWALVGIRLLCPIWIETPFSLQPELPGSLELRLSGTGFGEPGSLGQDPLESGISESNSFHSGGQNPSSIGALIAENTNSAQKGYEAGDWQNEKQDLQGRGDSDEREKTGNHLGLQGNSLIGDTGSVPYYGNSNSEASDLAEAGFGGPDTASGESGLEDSNPPGESGPQDSDALSMAGILRSKKFSQFIAILYLLGVGAACGIYLVQYILVKRQLATAIHETENIWLCENIQSPFVIGMFRSKIILPYGLTEFERGCVLKHEKTHIRHHDPLIRFAGLLCTCLHWWNPLVWLAVHKMNQDMEMFCDESALSGTTLEERKLYASTLLSCAKKQSGLLVGLSFGESNTERRVKNIMKKRKGSAIVVGLVVLLSIFCGITLMAAPKNEPPKEDNSGENAGAPSALSATPIPAADLTPQADATPFDPAASYRKISPQNDVAVYFNEDKQNPQVIVEWTNEEGTQYQAFDWDYNLDYGTPIVAIGDDFGFYFVKQEPIDSETGTYDGEGFLGRHWVPAGTVLRVILPTAELTEALNPFGAAEFCGVGYTVDCSQKISEVLPTENEYMNDLASFEIPEPDPRKLYSTVAINGAFYQEFLKYSTAGYRTKENGEEIFTLSLCANDGLKQYFEYPGLPLPEQETYPIVMEELSHFTETNFEYRRLGIKAGEDTIWLGKFLLDITYEVRWLGDDPWTGDYLFFPDKEIGYYTGHNGWGWIPADDNLQAKSDLQAKEDLWAGMPYRLEPEDTFDLDGDGVPEQIEYRNIMKNVNYDSSIDSVLLINGREVMRKKLSEFEPIAEYPYITSLDGKTYQFLIPIYDLYYNRSFEAYQYTDGELHYAGKFVNANYVPVIEDGKRIFRFTTWTHMLHDDCITRTYEYVDGNLREILPEYYEFLTMHGEEGETPHRPIFTAKADIELYREKGGSETFLLSAGCRVSTIQGDLKEWVLLENVDTGEMGWMCVIWDDDIDFCILPDGTVVESNKLFDGLDQFSIGVSYHGYLWPV